MSPPAKVLADAEVRLMVPVPVTVRLVDDEILHVGEALPPSVSVPELIAKTRVLVPDVSKPLPAPDSVTL